MTLEDATARHLAFLRAEKGASPHTISAYATDFSRFLAFASETYAIEDLERVSRELMISFPAGRGDARGRRPNSGKAALVAAWALPPCLGGEMAGPEPSCGYPSASPAEKVAAHSFH